MGQQIGISSSVSKSSAYLFQLVVAFALGSSAVLALAPFSFSLVLPVSFGGLYYLTTAAGRVKSFLTGWVFGFGYFLFGLSWIAESFFVEPERFGWLAVPAVIGLAGGLALFPAVAMVIFAATKTKAVSGALVFAACWSGLEWLRGTIFTGFPWNLIAYAWAEYDVPRQVAAFFGSYGLSHVTVLLAVLPIAAFRSDRRQRKFATTLFVFIAAAIWVNGEISLRVEEQQTTFKIRIVQGNIPQRQKWDPAYRERNIARYLDLSSQAGEFDILLWPESTFPGYLEEDFWMLEEIARLLPSNALLFTGAKTRNITADKIQYQNVILAINSKAKILGRYAKHHLVPFGEYIPLKGLVPLGRFAEGQGDFTAGSGPQTFGNLQLPKVGLSICYEAIFPGNIIDAKDRPEWIFNATNDGWFGATIGPKQHLASSRMRAVEEGLPFIRAAGTGISAIIDGKGRLISSLSLGETNILDGTLPAALSPTPFSRYGQIMFWLVFASSLALAVALNSKKNRVSGQTFR